MDFGSIVHFCLTGALVPDGGPSSQDQPGHCEDVPLPPPVEPPPGGQDVGVSPKNSSPCDQTKPQTPLPAGVKENKTTLVSPVTYELIT